MDLTIVVPVYNAEKTIERCLLSILKNGEGVNYTVEVIDDGSKDNSLQVMNKMNLPSNFHVTHIENRGVSNARNLGVELAEGKYIMFVDSDDTLIDELKNITDITAQGDPDIVVYGYKKEYLGSRPSKVFSPNKYLDKEAFFKKVNKKNVPCIVYLYVWNKAYKKSIIQDNNIKFKLNKKLGEDVIFNSEVLPFINKVYMLNKKIYLYNNGYNVNSLSRAKLPNYVRNSFEVSFSLYSKLKEQIGETKGINNYFLRSFVNCYFSLYMDNKNDFTEVINEFSEVIKNMEKRNISLKYKKMYLAFIKNGNIENEINKIILKKKINFILRKKVKKILYSIKGSKSK